MRALVDAPYHPMSPLVIFEPESLSIPVYRSSVVVVLGCLTLVLVNSARAGNLVTFSGATMGTRYAVTLRERDDLPELQRKVDARLADINKLMSTYEPDSELSRFNRHQGTDWFAVSRETAHVVQFALLIAAKTDGALDPTVGPLVNLWGFGPEGRRNKPPSEAEIEKARTRVGYQKLKVRLDPPALRKEQVDVYVDLSALAKGYAVDDITELLEQAGCQESLVAIAGDIRARGEKPDGSPWQIGVEEPDNPNTFQRTLRIADAAVSTSGDWRNAFVYEGVRYSHVIDPTTARPVPHSLASVTVLADTSIEADATDTALLVMGDERAVAWCEKHKVAAMYLSRPEDGRISARETSYVAKRIVQ